MDIGLILGVFIGWPFLAQMRAASVDKNLWLVGGGDLVGQIHDAGLLDEIIVQMGSVTLGSGKPLLPRQIAFPPLQLSSVRPVGTGFAELRYLVPVPNPTRQAGAQGQNASSGTASPQEV